MEIYENLKKSLIITCVDLWLSLESFGILQKLLITFAYH